MNTTQPIRNKEEIEHLKDYYHSVHCNPRNYLLIIIGLNTALRISDILSLQWKDVYDFNKNKIREHLLLCEQKTGKISEIYLNRQVKNTLEQYMQQTENITSEGYLFARNSEENIPISRMQAHRIIKKAASNCNIEGVISCHSLRKTFGYHAWKQGISPVMLMNIYNHSSFQVTKRYLGIEQDDRDQVFQKILL